MRVASPVTFAKKVYLRRLDRKLQRVLARIGSNIPSVHQQQLVNARALMFSKQLDECIENTRACIIAVKYLN